MLNNFQVVYFDVQSITFLSNIFPSQVLKSESSNCGILSQFPSLVPQLLQITQHTLLTP